MTAADFTPVAALPPEREPLDARTVERWVWCLVALGLVARTLRFLLCFPLWDDECFLMVNLIDRGYAELMQPLDYHQVAPLGFLWAERLLVNLFGYNEYAMRLLSFGCGIASLFLFRHLAKRLLSGAALVAAVGIFAVAYPCIRYAAEAKPYGSDLLAGLVLMTLCVEWRRRPDQSRWGWLLAAAAPGLIGLSYPAAFVAGGLSLWLIPTLRAARRPAAWGAWVAYNLAFTAAFAGFFLLTIKSQSAAELPFMTDFWKNSFPPLMQPWLLPVWFVKVHTGSWLSYPVGSENGGSALTFFWIAVATVVWLRTRRRDLLAFCTLPLLLNLAAAALHRYPYGGHVKLVHYAAGPICLMAGFGLAASLAWCVRRQASLLPALRTATAVLALVAVGAMGRDLVRPLKTLSDARHRDFARWFWFNAQYEGETCCVIRDLDEVFTPAAMQDLNWTAMYLCNQQIYSPRHQQGEPVRWDRVSNEHPLRCIVFETEMTKHDAAAEARWVDGMLQKYDLAGVETLPFSYLLKDERTLATMDHLRIYRFVPQRDPSTATAARQDQSRAR